MSDTLALLALMKKDEGLTEEQVNQVIDNKNLQPKLTAGENINISENNVISASGGIEIIDHDITQAELLAMPSKLFRLPNILTGSDTLCFQQVGLFPIRIAEKLG